MKNQNRQIFFVNQSSGYLMIDILEAFSEEYDELILCAGVIVPRSRPLPENVKVERTIPYNRTSKWQRIYTWSIAFIKVLYLILFKYRKATLFLVSNPPFTTFLPLFCKNPFFILIYDVFPDALVKHHVFSAKSIIIRFWEKVNKNVYARALRIFTLSKGMSNLISKYAPNTAIEVVPIWSDNDFLKPLPRAENIFLQEQDLLNKFVVLYSGNLGRSHDVEILVDLAARLSREPFFFLIIGEGDKYQSLSQLIANSGLSNIRLLPWQPVEKVPYTLASADIGVVSLGKEASLLSVPSKTFSLMSVGVPILGIADHKSELADLISRYNLGKCYNTENLEAMELFISTLASNPELHRKLRKNALEASKDFTSGNAKRFTEFINHV